MKKKNKCLLFLAKGDKPELVTYRGCQNQPSAEI